MDMRDQVVNELEQLLCEIESMIIKSGKSLDEREEDSLSIIRKNLTAEILRKCTERPALHRPRE